MVVKRLIKIGAGVGLGFGLLLASLPFWFLPAGWHLASRYGLEWDSHGREGYGGLVLNGVRFSRDDVNFTAQTVRFKMPASWIAGLFRNDGTVFLTVSDWSVSTVLADTRPAASVENAGTQALFRAIDQAGKAWNRLRRYLPAAELRRGSVHIPALQGVLRIERADWKHGALTAEAVLIGADGTSLMEGGGEVELRWPQRGQFALSLAQQAQIRLNPPPFARMFPDAVLNRSTLHFSGGWDGGPLHFSLHQSMEADLHDGKPVHMRLVVEGDRAGVNVQALDVRMHSELLMIAEGRVPLNIHPGDGPGAFVTWNPDAPFQLRASTFPEPSFWAALGEGLPAWPVNPVLFADVHGTLSDPRGRLRLTADRVGHMLREDAAGMLPPVTDVQFDLVFSEATAVLEDFQFRVGGQPVRITAALPLGGQAWHDFLWERQLPHWSLLEGRLAITDAEMGVFSAYFPAWIAPVGSFSADLCFKPGGYLEGLVAMRGAAIRPVTPTGAISDIQGEVQFEGRAMRIAAFTGRIGDRIVKLAGEAEVTDTLGVRYTVSLTGTGIPLVRRPGFLLRGDMDVSVAGATGKNAFAHISGNVDLRNGHYLSALRLPVPGSVTEPEQRPPFFSVDLVPFGDWTLDLRIAGREFLQMRSPVFNGLLSAEFQLGGTLREPLAPGHVTVNRGSIRFPFATLNVDRGKMELTQEDPFVINLDVVGDGRVFGYDVRMTLHGTADDPVLEFASTPPLGSDAVLLMITAGQLPERELEFTGTQRAARLALFLGQNLLYELTGDENIGDRLVIQSGRNISRGGRETYAIRYRVSDRVSVTGEYDEYDAINAGIRIRLFSR